MELSVLKPWLDGTPLETSRALQERIGLLQARTHQKFVEFMPQRFDRFEAEWVVPKAGAGDGIILYLHGGGYVGGDLEYARGFGAILSVKCGRRAFCTAYRLAPEHPYPAALEDALESYRYLLAEGFPAGKIILCGESAGGGLIFSLTMKLRELGLPLPKGIIALSPWTDLTLSGGSYETNRACDPSMTEERLACFASSYAGSDTANPYVSPLFGEFSGFPPSLIFVGGDEILLDDSVRIHDRLLSCGCRSELVVTPGMWHVYTLFGIEEARRDFRRIRSFLEKLAKE
jgi:acetyl esterase/lipase